MHAPAVFDLHCDTMTNCALKDIPLRDNDCHVNLETVKGWDHYVQCYAVWLPDDLRGEAAWQRFLQVAQRFSQEVEENKDCLEQLRAPGDRNKNGGVSGRPAYRNHRRRRDGEPGDAPVPSYRERRGSPSPPHGRNPYRRRSGGRRACLRRKDPGFPGGSLKRTGPGKSEEENKDETIRDQ